MILFDILGAILLIFAAILLGPPVIAALLLFLNRLGWLKRKYRNYLDWFIRFSRV